MCLGDCIECGKNNVHYKYDYYFWGEISSMTYYFYRFLLPCYQSLPEVMDTCEMPVSHTIGVYDCLHLPRCVTLLAHQIEHVAWDHTCFGATTGIAGLLSAM